MALHCEIYPGKVHAMDLNGRTLQALFRWFSAPRWICTTLLLLISGCGRSTVRPAQLSVQELTGALGITPLCAVAHYSAPRYARLVAITTDSTSSPSRDFRVRVLLFSDPKSGSVQRISYAIHDLNGGDGGESFIQIEPETIIQRMTTNNSNSFLYDIVLQKHSDIREIQIEMETSATPFPKKPSSP